jgi:hypothetical protein
MNNNYMDSLLGIDDVSYCLQCQVNPGDYFDEDMLGFCGSVCHLEYLALTGKFGKKKKQPDFMIGIKQYGNMLTIQEKDENGGWRNWPDLLPIALNSLQQENYMFVMDNEKEMTIIPKQDVAENLQYIKTEKRYIRLKIPPTKKDSMSYPQFKIEYNKNGRKGTGSIVFYNPSIFDCTISGSVRVNNNQAEMIVQLTTGVLRTPEKINLPYKSEPYMFRMQGIGHFFIEANVGFEDSEEGEGEIRKIKWAPLEYPYYVKTGEDTIRLIVGPRMNYGEDPLYRLKYHFVSKQSKVEVDYSVDIHIIL